MSNALAVAALFWISGLFGTVWNIITVSLRQQIVPDHLLGRVNSVYRFLGWGSMPLGALAGGLLADAFGLRVPWLVGGAVTAVCARRWRCPASRTSAIEAAKAAAPERAAVTTTRALVTERVRSAGDAADAGAAVDHVGLAGDPATRRRWPGTWPGWRCPPARRGAAAAGSAEHARRSCRPAPWRSRSSRGPARSRRRGSGPSRRPAGG